MASFDKYDTLVQANHDQLGSLEETFVLWKERVELLTTAADQSPGSQKMEQRRRERGDKKMVWECYVGHEARVSQLLQHLPVRVETYSKQNGWDFSKHQIRGAFLDRRSLLHPDKIMMSPRRTPSSSSEFSRQAAIDVLSEKFLTDNLPMPRHATWNILSMPVLGSDQSGVIWMRNVDWEPNIGDYHTTLSPISRRRNSCWLV